MDPRIAPLAETLRLNTRLFRNCLDGVTGELAVRRPTPGTNNLALIAAHMTDARYTILRILGAPAPNPLAAQLAGARSLDDLASVPTLAETEAAWTAAAHALRDRLAVISPTELDANTTTRLPLPDPTVLGTVTFLVQHDSYHLGQLALLRKYLGLEAMRYT